MWGIKYGNYEIILFVSLHWIIKPFIANLLHGKCLLHTSFYCTSQILCFLKNWRFLATLHQASYCHYISNSISSLCVSMSHFGNCSISNFFIIIVFVTVIGVFNVVIAKILDSGVPAVVQWIKNPTAATWVSVEVQVWSLVWHSGWQDLALPQLWHRSQLQLGFNPWLRNFHVPWV